MTLTEFLLARIAEEEAVARATLDYFDPLDWGDPTEDDAWRMAGPVDGPSGHGSLIIDPQRVLDDCKAKRFIILTLHPLKEGYCEGCGIETQSPEGCLNLRALALPYADHPDYDEAWRP